MVLSVASNAVALVLFWLFASAGWHKLRNQSYYRDLMQKQGLSKLQKLISIIAITELIIALSVVLPSTRYWGALLAIAMLLVYGIHLLLLYRDGKRDIDCGCGGPAVNLRISPALFWRNLSIALLSLLCLYPAGSLLDTTQWLVLPVATMAILSYLCIEQLIVNQQKQVALQ